MNSKNDKILNALLSGKAAKKYEGKQVVILGGEVYVLPRDDKKAKDFLNTLMEKYPRVTPTITFVPKHGTYILFLS